MKTKERKLLKEISSFLHQLRRKKIKKGTEKKRKKEKKTEKNRGRTMTIHMKSK